MQKKILIAIDDSPSSHQTVEYDGRMQGLVRVLGFTLLHIQPAISKFLLDEARRSGKVQAELNRVAARNAEAAKALLAKYKEMLVRAGAAESAVEVLPLPRHLGVAKDILDTDYCEIILTRGWWRPSKPSSPRATNAVWTIFSLRRSPSSAWRGFRRARLKPRPARR